MCTWNCEGWIHKFQVADIINYLSQFDIFCLSETFVKHEQKYDSFPDHEVFIAKATRLSKHGRSSGGSMIFIRNKFSKDLKYVKTNYENICILQMSKAIFVHYTKTSEKNI